MKRRQFIKSTALGNGADLAYYKPRTKESLLPKMGNFQKQWINACKGSLKTACDFEYSGNMIETILVGMVACRAGKNQIRRSRRKGHRQSRSRRAPAQEVSRRLDAAWLKFVADFSE